jgi:hypothetical protein
MPPNRKLVDLHSWQQKRESPANLTQLISYPCLIRAHPWLEKGSRKPASRVERVGFWPSPPPRQTVRTDFPYTAFAVTSSEALPRIVAKSFTDVADQGHASEHRTTFLPEDSRVADFAA